ncbi:MAG: FtsQ-type POTRA domain-containing protein [Betaproteobacteria bacterium]|nr:FtsQ-type POTRA domain-containing protein [Betaproteobacteria bacterium]
MRWCCASWHWRRWIETAVNQSARKPTPPTGQGFWHQPALMNSVADMLLVFATLGLCAATMAGLLRLPVFPLREVRLVTPSGHVGTAQIERVARRALGGNFFTVDLQRAREAFEELPWVRAATVRRRWPAAIELGVEEHVAVARWSDGGEAGAQLVNEMGEVFRAHTDAPLPSLEGPAGSASEVLRRYREFSRATEPLGRKTGGVALSPRLAWQLRMEDGMVLELGRDQPKSPVSERLSRFVAHYAGVSKKLGKPVAAVDLRYPNGFALRVDRRPDMAKGKS